MLETQDDIDRAKRNAKKLIIEAESQRAEALATRDSDSEDDASIASSQTMDKMKTSAQKAKQAELRKQRIDTRGSGR